MRASRVFHAVVLAALLLAPCVSTAVWAQALEVTAAVGLGAGSSTVGGAAGTLRAATAFSVAVRQVRVGSTTVGVALGHSGGLAGLAGVPVSPAAGTGAAQLDVTLSANQTFGPLGNVIFELTGSLRTDALAQADLTVRGTIGPLAARLRLSAFSADQLVFSPVAVADDDRPRLGAAGVGAAAGVTARFGRDVILDAEPEFYLTGAGLAARLEARLRRLRTFGDNELRLYLHGAVVPGSASGAGPAGPARWHGAVGAGVLWPRGRAPDVELAVLLGTTDSGFAPGLRVSWAEALAGGVRVDVSGSLELYRVDVHPLRVTAALDLPLDGGASLRLTGVGAAFDRSRPAAFVLQSTYRVPIDLR